MRAAVPGAVVGDHVGRADQPGGLDRHQLGVAGAEPDAVQPARHRGSLLLAGEGVDRGRRHRAAAAAAVHDQVLQAGRVGQRLLGLGGADEADRDAEDRGRPRAPSSISSSSRNSAVGALPIATTAPSRRSRHSSSAAAVRVVPRRAASSGTRGSRSVQMTSLPAGSRRRVTPEATIVASHRIGAPAAQRRAGRGDDAAGVQREVVDQVDHPAGVDHADRDLARRRRAGRPGRPPRGSWRTTGGRSPRRPVRSSRSALIRRIPSAVATSRACRPRGQPAAALAARPGARARWTGPRRRPARASACTSASASAHPGRPAQAVTARTASPGRRTSPAAASARPRRPGAPGSTTRCATA